MTDDLQDGSKVVDFRKFPSLKMDQLARETKITCKFRNSFDCQPDDKGSPWSKDQLKCS